MKTPVALIVFNRPDKTAQVFAAIRQARPPQLLVIADGARADRANEAGLCAATRQIIDGVDWPCEVLTNYADINLGCKRRVASGIDWVFSQVEAAIILEDDCLPDPSFFDYCDELLDKYRDDTRIAAISGTNIQFGRRRTNDSYYFSRYMHVWGWATWRRSWQHYDIDLKLWPEVRDGNWLRDLLGDEQAVKSWQKSFQAVYDGQIDTWDYQWVMSCWLRNSLTILPNVNLVKNLGFDESATHTNDPFNPLANNPSNQMVFPLQHPNFMVRNAEADDYTQQRFLTERLSLRAKRYLARRVAKFTQKLAKMGSMVLWQLT